MITLLYILLCHCIVGLSPSSIVPVCLIATRWHVLILTEVVVHTGDSYVRRQVIPIRGVLVPIVVFNRVEFQDVTLDHIYIHLVPRRVSATRA